MDYLAALERAIVYIENHLDEDLSAQIVARAAGYSYYHLTRQFEALLGEGIGSYIQKRRLADAAQKLLYTDLRVIDIAVTYGYASSEAFSRAFKQVYGVSPAVYRKNRMDLFMAAKPRLDAPLMRHLYENVSVHPRIVDFPGARVAGIRGQTTLRDNTIPQLWDELHALRKAVPISASGARGFGICEACSEGNSVYTMHDTVRFSEFVGFEIDPETPVPEPFLTRTIAGGKYAVFTHRGTLIALQQTFDYIWGTWLAVSKTTLDSRDDFELYDERYLGFDNPDSEIDLYIPIT